MNKKNIELQTPAGIDFQPGDIFLVRSNNLMGKLVRLIISIRYGIPFKEAFSHIESSYNHRVNISAEGPGVKLVNNNRFNKKTCYCVYRLKGMTQEKQKQHQQISDQYIGKGYAYARYFLDAARITTFYLVIMAVIFAFFGFVFSITFSKYLAVASAGFFILLTAIKPILLKKDILTHDCTELQSIIFSTNGLWIPLPKPRNEFPDGMKQVLDNLVLCGQAQVVIPGDKTNKPTVMEAGI